jgi:hypothetical protein
MRPRQAPRAQPRVIPQEIEVEALDYRAEFGITKLADIEMSTINPDHSPGRGTGG